MNNFPTKSAEDNYIFFTLGGRVYAFKASHILDITLLLELEYPEAMPDYVTGLLRYRNEIIKVVDIRNILKIPLDNYDMNSKIIVVKTKNDIFALAIDRVKEIRSLNYTVFNSSPVQNKKSYLEAIYTDKEISAAVLNLECIEQEINTPDKDNLYEGKSASSLVPSDARSKEILHRRKLQYSRKAGEISYDIIQKSQDTYMTFILNKNVCCIKIVRIAGFYKYENIKIIKVPCTPDFILGIASIKGRYITVIDLLKYTEGHNSKITKDTNIIVIEYEDYQMGIITDAIGDMVEMEENLMKIRTDNNSCLSECVVNDSLYLFLDVKKLFGDEKLYVS